MAEPQLGDVLFKIVWAEYTTILGGTACPSKACLLPYIYDGTPVDQMHPSAVNVDWTAIYVEVNTNNINISGSLPLGFMDAFTSLTDFTNFFNNGNIYNNTHSFISPISFFFFSESLASDNLTTLVTQFMESYKPVYTSPIVSYIWCGDPNAILNKKNVAADIFNTYSTYSNIGTNTSLPAAQRIKLLNSPEFPNPDGTTLLGVESVIPGSNYLSRSLQSTGNNLVLQIWSEGQNPTYSGWYLQDASNPGFVNCLGYTGGLVETFTIELPIVGAQTGQIITNTTYVSDKTMARPLANAANAGVQATTGISFSLPQSGAAPNSVTSTIFGGTAYANGFGNDKVCEEPFYYAWLTQYVCIHPLHPMDPSRTYIALDPTESFDSTLCDLSGAPIQLSAVGNTSGIAFNLGNDGLLQPAPSGTFSVNLPADSDHVYCRLGISGTEMIRLDANSRINFKAGMPAGYIATRPPSTSDIQAPYSFELDPESLTTTSWMTIYCDSSATTSGTIYFSQTAESVPYFPETAGASNALAGITGVVIPQVDPTTLEADATDYWFPYLPSDAITAPAEKNPWLEPGMCADFETRLAAPRRALAMNALSMLSGPPQGVLRAEGSNAVKANSSITASNGLGQLYCFDTGDAYPSSTSDFDTTITNIKLANVGANSGIAGTSVALSFGAVTDSAVAPSVASALVTPQQFAVITQLNAAGIQNPTLQLSGWSFDLSQPATSALGEYSNVLIWKSGRFTVREMACQPSLWTGRAAFTDETQDPNGTFLSLWLQNYFEEADALKDAVPAIARLLDVIDDPNWNGVLALKVDVDLNALPADLVAITSGVNKSLFFGHHLVVDVNHVADTNGNGLEQTSSLFGLIHYRAPDFDAIVGKDTGAPLYVDTQQTFQSKLLRLDASFDKSELQSFSCESLLTLNELFAETVTPLKPGKPNINTLHLYGSYHHVNDAPVYSFSTTPANGGESQPAVFEMSSTALQTVTLFRATMSAVQQGNETTASFALDGWLQLAEPAAGEIDLLSYEQLPFVGYQLDMTVQQDAALGTPPTFSLDATRLQLLTKPITVGASDLTVGPQTCLCRTGSFAALFPTTLVALQTGSSVSDLGGQGYQMMLTGTDASAATQNLGYGWHGLLFSIDLGALGALGDQHGLLADVLLTWSTTADGTSTQILPFFKLAGPAGLSLSFEIEDVLHIGASDVLLQKVSVPQKSGPTLDTMAITLQNFGISVMGHSFPPAGSTSVTLMAGIEPQASTPPPLAWFAGYAGS